MKLNWAERWVVNNPTRVFQQHIETKWLQRMMPLKAGATILEVGCGRGAGARLIQKAFKPSQLHILDLDIKMIQGAKTYLSGAAKKTMTMYVGDSIDLPFKSDALDALFGFGFLHHVPNLAPSPFGNRQGFKVRRSVLYRGAIPFTLSKFYHQTYPSSSRT